MNPIMKAFLDSIQLPSETSECLRHLEQIRDRKVVAISMRNLPFDNIHLDLLKPLEMMLQNSSPSQPVDLFLQTQYLPGTDTLALHHYLLDNKGSYGLIMAGSGLEGLGLVFGASECVLGGRAGFFPMPTTEDRCAELLRLQEIIETKHIRDPDNSCLCNNFLKLLDQDPPESDTDHIRLKRLLQAYLDRRFGSQAHLGRYLLMTSGLKIQAAEAIGIPGTMLQLEGLYNQILQISTRMEGSQQVKKVSHEHGSPMVNNAEEPFIAEAHLCAIMETVEKRYICFCVKGLPGYDTPGILWAEK